MLQSVWVSCPACWEKVALEVDLTAGSAEYYEDCPVCCQPMLVSVRVGENPEEFSVVVEGE